jgi:Flp pilus assembly protein TadG
VNLETRTLRPRDRRRSGQAIVELAIVLPLLLLLLTGVVDVGRAVFTYIALEDAAQEGSMYAAHEPLSESAVRSRVRTSSNHNEVTAATVSLVCTASPEPGTVTVTASYDLPLITPIAQLFGGKVALTATRIGTNFKGRCS